MRYLFLSLLLLCAGCAGERLELSGPLIQGGMIVGKAPEGAEVFLDGERLKTMKGGLFVFGFGRDHKERALLEARLKSGERLRRNLAVLPRAYKIERIDGLPSAMVTPPASVLKRLGEERRQKRKARSKEREGVSFAEKFIRPAEGRITGVYGSQRILNGEKRRPHFGLDIAAPTGAPVRAPAGGFVILAEEDFYFEGGLVFLDHGLGVVSAFLHLSEVSRNVGDFVERGGLIGSVGSSGRASGAHLDWRVSWRGRALDPALLIEGCAAVSTCYEARATRRVFP